MKDFTEIVVLLDKSGSMTSIRKKTIDGFNEFLNGQQSVGENARLTLVQFDEMGGVQLTTTYDALPIRQVGQLSEETYIPRGNTPLLDAMGLTIVKTGERLAAMPEAERPDKVVFVTITDGCENASKEYTKERIKEMVEHQESAYKWNFLFLGANQDAFAEASAVGISVMAAANFSPQKMNVAYANASHNVARYRGTGQAADLRWSEAQRKSMVDDDEQKKGSSWAKKTN